MDISQVKGHAHVKRVLEIALAGGHSMLITATRGMGKSVLLKAGETIAEQIFEKGKPYTIYDTSSPFVRLEEEATLTAIMRVYNKDRIILAAIPACDCGFIGDTKRICVCPQKTVYNYYEKLLPIAIEFPLYTTMHRIDYKDMTQEVGETSKEVIERIKKAHGIQAERYKGREDMYYHYNGYMGQEDILKLYKQYDDEGRKLLISAVDGFGITARQFYNVLKVARTVADMEGVELIKSVHIAEAIQYQYRPQTGKGVQGNKILF